MSELQRDVLKSGLPPRPLNPGASKSRFAGLVPRRNVKDYSPVDWSGYFEKQENVSVGDNEFRVYMSGSNGPVVLLLHGGGHSALSWAIFSKTISTMCECQTVAIDLRGHGETKTSDDYKMAADILAQDIADVVVSLFGNSVPPLVIMGHSMGGAIAIHLSVKKLLPSLEGLAVIDVVEGTALDALSSMQNFLRSRPQRFKSIEQGIEWSIRSGQLKNLESAKVSMSGQLKKVELVSGGPTAQPIDIPEESEEGGSALVAQTSPEIQCEYTWRVDLSKTEQYWKGWFENMSSLFLSCNVPKLLILAGIDRLDKEMTIAQMQGKFQMQVLPNCGHMVHEDVPDKVAEILTGFMLRQQLTVAKDKFPRHTPAC